MDLELVRPAGLEEQAWAAIEDCRARLERAVDVGDQPLIVGTAKELVESIARTVLDARGQPVVSGDKFQPVVNRAHTALERQPGRGLAADEPLRSVAQGAKTIATQLGDLRNSYGTGHGRSFAPDVAEEVVEVSVEAALLWGRWALRRLQHLIVGMPSAIARDLNEFEWFRSGELTDRLVAADLPSLPVDDQRLLGVAVARRAMKKTFVVREDGIDACVEAEDPRAWPSGYRAGLAEGLFLDSHGEVDVEPWGARATALVLATHEDAATVVNDLLNKIRLASWSATFANDAKVREQVVRTMGAVATALPAGDSQQHWKEIAAALAAE